MLLVIKKIYISFVIVNDLAGFTPICLIPNFNFSTISSFLNKWKKLIRYSVPMLSENINAYLLDQLSIG